MIGLRYIRTKCDLSLSDLAKKLHVSRQMVSAWENERKDIPENRLQELSEIFGIEKKYLGVITDEMKDEIESRPVYLVYESPEPEYRFDDANGGQEALWPVSIYQSLTEKYIETKKKRQDLLDTISRDLTFEEYHKYIYDEISMIENMSFFYECTHKIISLYQDKYRNYRVVYRCEAMAMFDAMMIALGIEDKDRLANIEADDSFWVKEDVAFARNLAEQIKDHWEEKMKHYDAMCIRPKFD